MRYCFLSPAISVNVCILFDVRRVDGGRIRWYVAVGVLLDIRFNIDIEERVRKKERFIL